MQGPQQKYVYQYTTAFSNFNVCSSQVSRSSYAIHLYIRLKIVYLFINLLCFLGCDTVDNVLCVLLSTSMFVGGLIGFTLDNIIPGLITFSN